MMKDVISIITNIFLGISTYYCNIKIQNYKYRSNIIEIFKIVFIIMVAFLLGMIKNRINFFVNTTCLMVVISIFSLKNNLLKNLIITIISLSLNYVFNIIGILVSYILCKFFHITNDYIILNLILLCRFFCIYRFFKIKKFKYGFPFFSQNSDSVYSDIITLNVGIIVLFIITFFTLGDIELMKNITPILIIFSIIMIITIVKSIQVYYKQKLLIKDLKESKEELEFKKSEIMKLEEEILNYSKSVHSLVHKQKSLEYKINKLINKIDKKDEIEIKNNFENISKELYHPVNYIKLDKTEISEIDDMIDFMKSECQKYNIEFNLQLNGNIYEMINDYIPKNDLEILLADHIKNAIIAVNHTDNVNKSILVRLGKIDNCYGLYIYDSGIEFKKDILKNLGKIPITSYKNEGGTGMGFMNTFETLNKFKASLIIKEIGLPSINNYTKIIMIKLDGKNEFKVISNSE